VRRFAYIALVVVVLWIFLGYLATIPVAGNHPYWREVRATPKAFGLNAEDVSFLSQDGIPLKGWFIRSEEPSRATVIIAHGINGNRSDMLSRAAFLAHDSFNTLLVDLRDHGESGGSYAGPGYMESRDILGALTYLRNRGETGPVVAMGHSYGAVAALYAAAQSPDIAAVIADSGFISFEDMVSRATTLLAEDPERSFWERLGLRVAGFRAVEWAVKPIYYLRTGVWLSDRKANSLTAISRIAQPILFISGGKDEICPPQNAMRMYDAARNSQKRILMIPNADHDTTYATSSQLYESTVMDFLRGALQEVPVGDSEICQTCK
jgi:pimeloyl-ACP methyl ester carboxylesterase